MKKMIVQLATLTFKMKLNEKKIVESTKHNMFGGKCNKTREIERK